MHDLWLIISNLAYCDFVTYVVVWQMNACLKQKSLCPRRPCTVTSHPLQIIPCAIECCYALITLLLTSNNASQGMFPHSSRNLCWVHSTLLTSINCIRLYDCYTDSYFYCFLYRNKTKNFGQGNSMAITEKLQPR